MERLTSTTTFLQTLSQVIGWTYVLLWSISFYPQCLLNIHRRSTSGLSIDFALLNLLGLTAYAVSNGVMLFSSTVREQYARRHPEAVESTVRVNDFVYGVHGAVMCGLIYSQFCWPRVWGFGVREVQRSGLAVLGVFWGSIVVLCGAALVVVWLGGAGEENSPGPRWRWEWIDVIYTLGNIKLFATVLKYAPQVWHNHARQSTEGFSIYAILMDLSGGLLSIFQLLLDSSVQSDWSGVTGNPAKFVLGNITLVFNVIFTVQHYVLYKGRGEDSGKKVPGELETESESPGEEDPLLGPRGV